MKTPKKAKVIRKNHSLTKNFLSENKKHKKSPKVSLRAFHKTNFGKLL
jgi:hypothetical protein